MKCANFKNQMSAFQDGALSTDQMKSMASHLESCDHCRELYEESQAVWGMLSVLPEPEPQSHFYTRLKARMDVESRTNRTPWIQRAILPVMTTAMLALGVLLGSAAGRTSQVVPFSDGDLFYELPLEELNVLSDQSSTSGYVDIFDLNGGVE